MIAVAMFGGFVIGVAVCLADNVALRRRLARFREVNGYQGEEIVSRKIADWESTPNYLKTGDRPSLAFDVEAEK